MLRLIGTIQIVTYSQNAYRVVFFLTQHVDKPPRYWGMQRPSVLDLVQTNQENVMKKVKYGTPLGKSDHCTLVFEYACRGELALTKTKKYKYDKGVGGNERSIVECSLESRAGEKKCAGGMGRP